MRLYPHQEEVLQKTSAHNRVAYYLDMGLGKTFVGSEKMKQLEEPVNLVICQKSKISDWAEHFKTYYPDYEVHDLSTKTGFMTYLSCVSMIHTGSFKVIGVINYDLVWRRPELLKLEALTLMLDESSYIKNEKSKRTKFIMRMNPKNVILLSGTPTGGKYEELWSQCRLLGWVITKNEFYHKYVRTKQIDVGGFPLEIIIGYKNVDDLILNLGNFGAVFMKTEDVIKLPETMSSEIRVKSTPHYKRFQRDKLVVVDGVEMVGDTSLTYLLYLRQLAGAYNPNKAAALEELLEGTRSRVVIFYNFNSELATLKEICKKLKRPTSEVNGSTKDLSNYQTEEDCVVLVQFQAGAMGINLQKSTHLVYYSLPLSSELYEQSKKRIHRLGQTGTCFYYYLLTDGTIEADILATLDKRQTYTLRLFDGSKENDRKKARK